MIEFIFLIMNSMFYKVQCYGRDRITREDLNKKLILEEYVNQTHIESIKFDVFEKAFQLPRIEFGVIKMSSWVNYYITKESCEKIISSLHIE